MHQTRYAHCEGYTDICFADNGKFLTTGEDGDVRIFQGFDDLDHTSFRVGDKCFALAYKNGKIFVSDELNEVKRYDLESNELQGVITSFTLPATCIAINKSNASLVCGASDFEIHLVDLKTLKFTTFTGHDAPILHVCFDPLEKFFVSSSCDGTARFWSVQTLNTVKTLTNLHPKSNDFADSPSLCKIAWHKDGTLIAVPSHKEVHFYERETWLCKFKINMPAEGSDEFYTSIVSFSPDGQHILATTSTQMVYVHSIINKALVFKYAYTKATRICSLAWNPSNQNEVLFCDIKGQLGLIKPTFKKEEEKSVKKGRVELSQDDSLEMESLMQLIDSDSRDSEKKSEMRSPSKKKRKRLSDDDEMHEVKSKRGDDEEDVVVKMASDDDDDDEMVSLEKLKSKTFESVKKEILSLENDEDEVNIDDEDKLEKSSKISKKSVSVASFQASSTPLTLTERYMVWNSIGLITQFMKEGDESIDIEFHNASYHHTIHLKNQFGYTMGDMSKEAVVLASPGKAINDEEIETTLAVTSQSKLACILLNPCDNHKEWSIEMPRKEYIKAICVSRTLLACGTSRRFLRVFGLSGMQREIVALNGSPLAISAYDNCLFVTYVILQTVNYSIFYFGNDEEKGRETESGILPLSENSTLEWLGFSDEGNPYFYDSNGFLFTRCLSVSKLACWTPLADMRSELKHKSDNYWLVGVAERSQMVKAILCRASKYPLVLPRPNLSMVGVKIPFCEVDSEKTQMERDYWKNKHFSSSFKNYDWSTGNLDLDQDECDELTEKFEASTKEVLMKLFIFSCKSGKEQRAFEVASIMDSTSLQLAIKYATKTRALVLAQNLNLLAEKKAALEYEKQRHKAEEEYSKTVFQVHNVEKVTTEKYTESEVSMRATNDNDVLFDSETQPASANEKSTFTSTSKSTSNNDSLLDDTQKSCATPTMSSMSRHNPFKAAAKTPLNDASKSIINELEEKALKQSASKEKDAWKPTPTRKLVKSKVSNTPTGSLGSFFSNKK